MIKIRDITITALITILTMASRVSAQEIPSPIQGFDIGSLVQKFVQFIPVITVIGCTGAILTIAFTLIFVWGQDTNAEPVKKARNIAKVASIGFGILVTAPFILGLLLSLLGVQSTLFTSLFN